MSGEMFFKFALKDRFKDFRWTGDQSFGQLLGSWKWSLFLVAVILGQNSSKKKRYEKMEKEGKVCLGMESTQEVPFLKTKERILSSPFVSVD